MPFLRLDNFGSGGIGSDPFEESIPPSQWQTLGDIDFSAGDLINGGGEYFFADCDITPKRLFFYESGADGYLFATDFETVSVYDGSSWTELLTGLGGGDITFTVFLGSLVLNSTTDGPYYWDTGLLNALSDTWEGGEGSSWESGTDTTWESSGSTFPDSWASGEDASWEDGLDVPWQYEPIESLRRLPGWFENATCLQMIAYKNFLVAIGVDDPTRGGKNNFLVCWSDISPAGGIPGGWSPEAGNLAGDTLVLDTPGALSGAALMRDDLIVYKTDSVYRMTYVPSSPLVMAVERILADTGIDYPQSVCSLTDTHFLVTRAGLEVFNGQQAAPIDFARVQEDVRQILGAAKRQLVEMVAYPGAAQIWIAYRRSTADTTFFGILKYDLQHRSFTTQSYSGLGDTWETGESASWAAGSDIAWEESTGLGLTALCNGAPRESFLTDPDTWVAGEDASWSGGSDISWALGQSEPVHDTVFMAVGSQIVRYKRIGNSVNADGSFRTPIAERHGIRLTDNSERVIVRGVYPMVEGDGELLVSLGKNYDPWGSKGGENVSWAPTRVFKPGVDRFLPMRSIGDNFSLRISSIDGMPWRLSAIGIEFDVLGKAG